MLGDTLTLPQDASTIELNKIDDSKPYTSEYHLNDGTSEVRVIVRHSKTKATATKPSYDRHNVEVTRTVFATETVAEFQRKAYFVWEHLPSDTSESDADGLCDYLIGAGLLTALRGWQS
jgi:hypothetical protein